MKQKFNLNWMLPIYLLFMVFSCTPKTEKVITDAKAPKSTSIANPNAQKHQVYQEEGYSKSKYLSKRIPMDPDFRTGELPNGMKYYIKKNTKPENRAELRLALKAGAVQEDEDQLGLAHFIEHMQFNGTEHFTKNELVNYLEKVGTKFGPDLNAYTSFDETVYMLQVRTDVPEQLDTGMLVLYDWAGKATLEEEEIDKERGVVISEWRTDLSPNQRMQQVYFPIMYKGSRYAKRLPIGDPEIVKNASYDVIRRFYKDWYRPDLMAVIVIGDVDVDKMETKIFKMFSKIGNPNNPRPREKYNVPPQKGTAVSIVTDKEAPFSNVWIVNKLPHIPIKTKKDYLETIKRRLFNMMLNSRLKEIQNGANPTFTFGYTRYSKNIGDIDAYSSWAIVPEGKELDALKTFTEENERVLRYGFTQTELDREKKNMLTSAEKRKKEKGKTESRRFASKAVYHFLENSPMLSADQYYNFLTNNLDDINLQSVNSLAKNWIKEDNRVVVITGQQKESVVMPTEQQVLGVLNNTKTGKLDAYVDKTVDKPLFSKNLPLAEVVKSENFDKYGIKKMVLKNGLEVYYKKTDFKNDEILFSAYSPGGSWLYDDNDYLDADYCSWVVEDMGISEFDNVQLNKLLTGKQVSVNPYVANLYDYFRGESTVKDLETMFQLINLYFTAPRKDAELFESFKIRQKGLYKNLLSEPRNYFRNLVSKIKYNNHLRASSMPQEEDFDKLNLDRLFEIYKERFGNASDFKFFFVGNFDENKLKTYIQKYLGNLPGNGNTEEWVDRNLNMVEGKVDKTIYHGIAPKTYVDRTYHGDFDWSPENEFLLNSLVKVMSIKLRESLREDKGGVYGVGVYGYGSKEPKQEYKLSFSFNSNPENAQDLIKAADEVINKLKTEGPDEEVMTKIKETKKQSRIKDLKENEYWLDQMNSIVKSGLDFSELTLDVLQARLDKLTAEDIKKAANKYLDESSVIEVKMYPENSKK